MDCTGETTHREQHEIRRQREIGARHFPHLAVLSIEAHRLQRFHLAALFSFTADERFGRDRPVALHALFVR